MVREIIHDTFILQMRSKAADETDLQTAVDLLDTLKANAEHCVGMAANMIGVSKRIIAFNDNGTYTLMFNPEIIKCSGVYEVEEGCLSLSGTRRTKRYKTIKVKFENEKLQPRIKTYTDYTAQIIQHEIDHCNGILI
ncbi:MAG: peptide deformylase [Oscillospiraceae bacterium]|nr:peptide deformylase [Oscillospiraceae bacterium]